jgi:death-on-curing family protein
MPSKVEKVKPDKEVLKKPVELPTCEVKEGEVWYPPVEFLIYAHDIMIKRYGYWSGFEVGIEPYHHFIEEAKNAQGTHRKAAILLKRIATSRIFQDGHHRTAFEVTKAFLEMNGEEFKEKNEQNIIKFIKDIRKYSIEDIESWLKNGSL